MMNNAESHRQKSKIVLRTEDLSRIVGDKSIVEGVNVAVKQGEVLAVVGSSGSGKSSFLRMLNRLDEPTRGKVFLDGQDYREIPPRELRRRVGMLMQAPNLFPGSVGDNLRFGPRQRGEDLPDERIGACLASVGLAGRMGENVAHLSGGEAQRVSLARTLMNSPEVLLLDEPTSALDEATKDGVEALIFRVVREQALTCLIVTHDPRQAARIADRVMVMDNGRVKAIGSVEEVLGA